MAIRSGVLAAGLLIGCLTSPSVMAQGRASIGNADTPADIVRSCETCHGPGGNSVVPSTPRLNGQQADYIVNWLKDFLDVTRDARHPTNSMWDIVSSSNNSTRSAIANYFAHQPHTDSKPGALAAEGKRIYEKGVAAHDVIACQLCHGAHGEGHDATPRLAGQHTVYLKAQLLTFSVQFRDNDLMHPNTDQMTDGEIDALTSYLAND